MNLQPLNISDAREIEQLFNITFSDSEGDEEGVLIGGLAYELITETESADQYGFVAVDEGKIVGAIIFSRLRFESKIEAFILAPVAVLTAYQGKGTGQKLIRFGIDRMRRSGVELLVTYGDPRFYSKLGFEPITEEIIQAPLTLSMPEGWLAQNLTGDSLAPIPGRTQCVKALNKPVYW